MAKQSCCHKKKLRRGLWSPEEDEKLMNHIAKYGHGCWSSVPKLAGITCCICIARPATLISEHHHSSVV
jgi:myb proto-oncogene protein